MPLKSLTSRISWGISLLILLLIGILSTLSLHYFEDQLQANISRQQFNMLANLAKDIDQQLDTGRQLVHGLALTASAADFTSVTSAERFIEQNPGLQEVFRHGIHLYRPDGSPLASHSRPPQLPFDSLPEAYLAPPLQHRQPHIAPPFAVRHLPLLMITAPVFDSQGQPLGLVAGTQYLLGERLLGRLSNISLGETGFLYLFDRQGLLLAHPELEKINQPVALDGHKAAIDKALHGFEGTLHSGPAEQQSLATFKQLDHTNWVLAAHYPVSEAYAAMTQARQLTIVGVVFIGILTLLAAWQLMRQLSAPLKNFTAQVGALSRGEKQLLSLPKRSPSELATLGKAFNGLLSDLQTRSQKIHEQQSFMESLLENTAIACYALDPEHRVLLWNRAAEQLTGIAANRLIGSRDHWQAFYAEQRPCLADLVLSEDEVDLDLYYETAGISPLNQGGFQAEGWFSNLNGKDRYLLSNATPVYTQNGVLLAVIQTLEDITELRRTHEDMDQALSLLNATLEATADGIVVQNLQGQILRYNQRAAHMWKLTDALQQSNDLQYLNERILEQIKDPDEYRRRTKAIYQQPDQDSFDTIEFKDGRCFERTSKPQLLDQKIIGRVWSYHDITEQSQLEQSLHQAQKMEAVGQLAGGIAHDFNNLLTVINGYSDLLVSELAEDSEHYQYADLVLQAGLQAADLTGQLLAFGRRQLLNPQILELNDLIRKNQKLLSHLLREDMLLDLKLAACLPAIKADPNQMEQILINLAVNARDAMPSGGRLVIMTCTATLDAAFSERHPGAEPGEYLRLTVSDNGCGMDEEVRARIFEPFYTTKGRGKGTGLGLATVYGIVKQSDGYISVDSAPGAGTSFDIYLPVSSETTTPARAPAKSLQPGDGRVLVVENETSLRDLALSTLENNGYTVLGASSAEQAQELVSNHAAFDLLVSDIVMTGMNGLDLARQLGQSFPQLKVLLMTGYTEHQVLGFESEPPFPLLQKPFLPEDLLRQVQAVLQE